MFLSGFQQEILQMSKFNITFIIDFIYPIVEYNLLSIQLTESTFFLISQLVYLLTQSFIVIKVPFIVTHVGVKLYFLFVLFYLR